MMPAIPPAKDATFIEELLLPWVEALVQGLEGQRYTEGAGGTDWQALFAREVLPRADGTALLRLSELNGVEAGDLLVLAAAAGPYLNPRIGPKLGELQGSSLADRLTVGLALDILHPNGAGRLVDFGRFDPDVGLFRHGLLTLGAPVHGRGDALVEKLVCVPQRTLDLLLGHPRLDERLRGFVELERTAVELAQVIVPEAARKAVLTLVGDMDRYKKAARGFGFQKAIPYGRGIVILLAGPPGTGKTLFARALAHHLGRPLFRVYADKLAETEEGVETVVETLFREVQLHGGLVFFDECESLLGKRGPKLGFLLTELERQEGIVLLATNLPQQLDPAMDRRIVYRMDFAMPGPLEREAIWELHIPPEAPISPDVDIPLLANRFNFSGGVIKNAVLVALSRALEANPTAPVLDMATLRAAAESQLKYNLEDFALRSQVSLNLTDLVLPEGERKKLDEVLSACRNKDYVQNRWGLGKRLVTGKGISVLFDGPPGTGKTLCAEILARELDRPLFRVHIPNVVSKWVGETEKNISEIFGRAQATQAILLFDEADSLFSKRTEVKSSNDRYSNQEVNLLLQEIERYSGIVILTTNLFGSLDDALKRRLQYRITFPLPGVPERAKIWETLMPREAPIAPDVDYQRLAKTFEFAGGNIKNAIVRACYRAYGDGGQITFAHLADAGRVESEASGMIVREAPTGTAPRMIR